MTATRTKPITATLIESRLLTEQVMWFRFRLSEPINFLPGQFVSLRFRGEPRYHAFSIASTPAKRDEIELIIKLEKDFTARLFASPPATEMECLGPLGRFMSQLHDDVVMIGGGVGVTPFLSLVRWARDASLKDRQYWLLYSCKTRAGIFNEEELRKLHEQNPNVHVIFTLTRETPLDWDGELGRFDQNHLLKHLGSLEGKSFYVCGPNKLTEAMTAMLLDDGVPKDQIFSEGWG